jgi:ribonuclease HI
MVYIMKIYADGCCRGNGKRWAIGAAAAVLKKRDEGYESRTNRLPSSPTPTNQRAEIMAIILALELALEKYNELNSNPRLDVTIYSDSRYAVECMNNWIYRWTRNGWTNAMGNEVVNRDLIERASDLDDDVKRLGDVDYKWIAREDNDLADRLCNKALDGQESDDDDSDY